MTEQKTIKNFGEVYRPQVEFEGEKIAGKEVVGIDIIIHDFAMLNGAYGQFAVVDATILAGDNEATGKRVQFPEGSEVIKGQLAMIKEDKNFPIRTKIEERTSEKSKLTYRTLA